MRKHKEVADEEEEKETTAIKYKIPHTFIVAFKSTLHIHKVKGKMNKISSLLSAKKRRLISDKNVIFYNFILFHFNLFYFCENLSLKIETKKSQQRA